MLRIAPPCSEQLQRLSTVDDISIMKTNCYNENCGGAGRKMWDAGRKSRKKVIKFIKYSHPFWARPTPELPK